MSWSYDPIAGVNLTGGGGPYGWSAGNGTFDVPQTYSDEHTFDPLENTSIHDLYAIMVGFTATIDHGGTFTAAYIRDAATNVDFELRNINTGALEDPAASPTQIRINAFAMRPTALSWSGQDPLNDANRILWERAEIPNVLIHVETELTDAELFDPAGYSMQGGAGVLYYDFVAVEAPPRIMCVL